MWEEGIDGRNVRTFFPNNLYFIIERISYCISNYLTLFINYKFRLVSLDFLQKILS